METNKRTDRVRLAPRRPGGTPYAGPASDLASPIAYTRASDKAEHYLRSLIFSGRLLPGDRLPSERELATMLGISVITLRAALRSLEAGRFLVVKVGAKGGWFVNDAAAITDCWQEWLQEHQEELNEVLELLEILETTSASLAAQRRTAEDLEALQRAGEELDRDWPSIARWHNSFHDALARAAHNTYLERTISTLRGELFLPVEQAISDAKLAEIRSLHERILAAIRAKDPQAATEAMKHHFRHRRGELLGPET